MVHRLTVICLTLMIIHNFTSETTYKLKIKTNRIKRTNNLNLALLIIHFSIVIRYRIMFRLKKVSMANKELA